MIILAAVVVPDEGEVLVRVSDLQALANALTAAYGVRI